MSGPAHAACTVVESGWQASGAGPAAPFRTTGADLDVEIRRIRHGDPGDAAASADHEELVAVLEGRFALAADDGAYDLAAGMAVLIPRGVGRRWTVLSDEGVLYRVWRR